MSTKQKIKSAINVFKRLTAKHPMELTEDERDILLYTVYEMSMAMIKLDERDKMKGRN